MKEIIELLKNSRVVDEEIFRFQNRVEQIPSEIAALDHLFQQEKGALTTLEEKLKQMKLQLKEKEVELKSQEDQIKKYDSQLQQVKTNKEYASLKGEIAMLKTQSSKVEDQIILTLDQIGGLEKQISDEKVRLEQRKQGFDQKKAELDAEKKTALEMISARQQDREQMLAPLEKEARDVYERAVKKRQGTALAKIDGENCSGCRMRIRPQIINETHLGAKLVLCENCSRILYIE